MMDLSALDRHTHIALSFSGGKDSLACVYLLRDQLERVTIYHMDTGDLLPEMRAIVEHVKTFAPNFVHLRGDVLGWIDAHGLPTDLMPHSAHPIGQAMAEGRPLVARYDCCWINLMGPIYQRIHADGNTLLIRGTKQVDMARLPARTGDLTDGMELLYPIEGWSNAEVFAYLRSVGAPIARVYDHVTNSPECARCSAWWGEGRNAYLRRYHPALWLDYMARLRSVIDEIEQPLANLRTEVQPLFDPPVVSYDLVEVSSRMAWDRGVRILQGNRLGKSDEAHVGVLMDYMRPPPASQVLDIGCGFGEVARLMQLARPDLEFAMLTNSVTQLARLPEQPALRAVLGDMHQLPFAAASFDGAMALYALCHADQVIALREAARVVRGGGFLLVYDYARTGGDNRLVEAALGARFFSAHDLEASAVDAGWQLDRMEFVGGDDGLFRRLFGDDDRYNAIFADLRPAVWRFERVGSS